MIEWVEKACWPVEGGRDFFEDTVAKNIRLGRFLILIVGDKIRQSLIDMLNYVSKYPHLATGVILVELSCYQWETQKSSWPLLVVPSVVARTEIVERSVIQITLDGKGAHQIDVKQEKAEEKGKRKRVTLTEEAFWGLLKNRSPKNYDMVRQIISEYRDRDGIQIEPAEGSMIIRKEHRCQVYTLDRAS